MTAHACFWFCDSIIAYNKNPKTSAVTHDNSAPSEAFKNIITNN